MQSVDCLLHVSANKSESVAGLAMFYNPSLSAQNATFDLNLYYANEPTSVTLAMEENTPVAMTVMRDYTVPVSVELGPRQVTYAVIRRG
jgi:hypothetical protein